MVLLSIVDITTKPGEIMEPKHFKCMKNLLVKIYFNVLEDLGWFVCVVGLYFFCC